MTAAPPKKPRPTEKAFTLLEVLLAITITGFVLAAATGLVVSVSNIWTNRQDSHFFEDHVDGVTEFLSATFARAGVAIQLPESGTEENETTEREGEDNGDANGSGNNPRISIEAPQSGGGGNRSSQQPSADAGLLRAKEDPITWASPPGFAAYRDPLLNFQLSEAPPLLVGLENAPTLGIDAFLYFQPDEGLSLLWYSILQEEVEDERDLRRTPISPLVSSIRYIYWDERFERWEEEPEPREGENEELLLPRYLRLEFEYGEVTLERTIAIPVHSASALIF